MNQNYFYGCETVEDCKQRYKELSKTLHPDMGGKAEEFNEMFDQYQEAIADITAESPFLTDEFVNLCKAGIAMVKKTKPSVGKNIEVLSGIAPFLAEYLPDGQQKRNVKKFLGKLNGI